MGERLSLTCSSWCCKFSNDVVEALSCLSGYRLEWHIKYYWSKKCNDSVYDSQLLCVLGERPTLLDGFERQTLNLG